ncbi:MAG: PIN domain-containing protein [Verrucomicrobiota bacterium]|nr:PIN domain-containing protein [Verrucomicrobiota bacterium]
MADLHLDTNALIALADPALPLFQLARERIGAGDLPATCAVAWHEFVRGPASKRDVAHADEVLEGRIVAVDREAAEKAAALFRKTGSRRASTADCLIAAVAIQAGAALLTANREDFIRFESDGLRLLTP